MENSTEATTQEQPVSTTPVQTENPIPTPTETQQYDSSESIAAIRAAREGRTTEPVQTEQPKAEPVQQEAPKVEPAPEVKNEPVASFTPEDFIKEISNGNLGTAEQLKETLNSLKNPVSLLSEHQQQILRVFETHENPQEYFAFQQKDFKAMDSQQVLRENFLKANSDLDAELGEAAFQKELMNKYPHLDSEEDSTDYKLAKRELEREAEKVRTDLIKQQEESRIKLPEPVQEQQPDPAEYEKYLESAKAKASEFNEIKVKVGEDGSEITIGVKGKENFEKALANPFAYIESNFTQPDGTWNIDSVLEYANFKENRQAYDSAIYEAGKEAGTKSLIDEKLKNPTPLQPSQNNPSDSGLEETKEAIRRRNANQTSNI